MEKLLPVEGQLEELLKGSLPPEEDQPLEESPHEGSPPEDQLPEGRLPEGSLPEDQPLEGPQGLPGLQDLFKTF